MTTQYTIEYDFWFKPHKRAKRENWTRVRHTWDKHPTPVYDTIDQARAECQRMKLDLDEVDNFTIHKIELVEEA